LKWAQDDSPLKVLARKFKKKFTKIAKDFGCENFEVKNFKVD